MPSPPINVPRETQERLDAFVRLLSRWNRTLNLVSKGDLVGELRDRHLRESITLTRHLPAGIDRFIDLGSGGGLPALPIAITTGIHVDLVEADQRKAAFLETALATLGIHGTVWAERIETCPVPAAHCVTARALAPLPLLLAYTYPLLQRDGIALFLKGDGIEMELHQARRRWQMQAEIIAPQAHGSRILKISRLEPVNDPSR